MVLRNFAQDDLKSRGEKKMKKRILFIILSLVLVMLKSSFAEDSGQPKSIFEQYLEARKGFLPKSFLSTYEKSVQTDFLINDLAHYIESLELSGLKTARLDNFRAVVGDSRSLHRGRVTFEDPRMIVAIPLIDLGTLHLPNQESFPGIILAYAPLAKQLEVMSWVPQTGTYAFHVIDNYESDLTNGYYSSNEEAERKKRVEVFPTMPKRESCLSCHQNGGPIFTHRPWAETPYDDDITRLKMKEFIRHSGVTGNSPGMDGIIRTVAKHIQVNRIAREICENNVACRRFLLGLALIGNHPGMNELTRQKLNQQFYDLIKDAWPKDGFGYASSVLPDRHFRSEKIKNGITPLYLIANKKEFVLSLIDMNDTFFKDSKGLWSYANSHPEFTIDEIIRVTHHETDREILTEISKAKFLNYIEGLARGGERLFLQFRGIKKIPIYGYLEDLAPEIENLTPADPRYLRPLVGEIPPQYAAERVMKHLYSVFGFNQEIMQELTGVVSFDILYELAFQNTEWMNDLVASPVWPPSGNAVRKTIKDVLSNVLRVKKADQDLEKLGFKHYIDPSKIQEEEKEEVIPKETPDSKKFSDDNATKILKSYCSSCHGGQNPKSGIELPLDDPQALKKYRDDSGYSVTDHLTGVAKPMPPADSKPLSEEERKAIIEWLRNIQQPQKKE